MALIGVVISLYVQSRENDENHKYLQEQNKYNQEILNKTRLQIELQEEIGRVQNFENTFFHLMNLFKNTSLSIKIEKNGNYIYGVEAIESLLDDLQEKFKNKGSRKYIDIYEDFYRSDLYEHLGVYFKVLYSLLKYIDNSEFLDSNKYKFNRQYYAGIARANISSNELNILFYNCLSSQSKEQFKPLIEEYALFEHIPSDSEWYPSYYVHEYSKEAYGYNQRLIDLWNKYEEDLKNLKNNGAKPT